MEKELKVMEERETITTEEDIDKNNPAYFENNEKENNENREFYVYEHIRLDNMTCFYVGKGRGNRAYDLARNDHHNRISNRHGHAVVIIKNHLTEKEAFELERDTIEDYVFNLGYGIDIDGYRDYSNKTYLTNCTFGGEGASGLIPWNKGKKGLYHCSEETKLKLSESLKGKNHPLYGKHHSKESKKKMSESKKGRHHSEETKLKMSESRKGKNHPMYGKHHSEETRLKMSESLKGKMAGKNHPMYGKHHSEESKKKMSELNKGKNNPMYGKHHSEETKLKLSKKVICVTTGKIFNSQKEASNYYKCSGISLCCEGIRKSAGKLPNGTKLQWKYVKNYNNDFKGILINPWNKGKKLFEEHELKLSKTNSKKVICITTGEIFNIIKYAGYHYGISPDTISACCKGKRKTSGVLNHVPLQWKYLEDYNNEFKGILINPIITK